VGAAQRNPPAFLNIRLPTVFNQILHGGVQLFRLQLHATLGHMMNALQQHLRHHILKEDVSFSTRLDGINYI
jgi:hypothetical protein